MIIRSSNSLTKGILVFLMLTLFIISEIIVTERKWIRSLNNNRKEGIVIFSTINNNNNDEITTKSLQSSLNNNNNRNKNNHEKNKSYSITTTKRSLIVDRTSTTTVAATAIKNDNIDYSQKQFQEQQQQIISDNNMTASHNNNNNNNNNNVKYITTTNNSNIESTTTTTTTDIATTPTTTTTTILSQFKYNNGNVIVNNDNKGNGSISVEERIVTTGDDDDNNNVSNNDIDKTNKDSTTIIIDDDDDDDDKFPIRLPIPNVLIAGVQKGGTSAIAEYLRINYNACYSNPNTKGSQGGGKEVHFFDNPIIYNTRGIDFYINAFKHCKQDQQLLIDGTPESFRKVYRIYDTYKKLNATEHLRIIISLREPVSRDISWYNHRIRDCTDNPNSYAALCLNDTTRNTDFKTIAQRTIIPKLKKPNKTLSNYEKIWVYEPFIKLWFKVFNRKHILILSYDEAKSNPSKYTERIYKFLNIPGEHISELKVANAGKSSSMIIPSCTIQHRLWKHYEPYNNALYTLLHDNPGPDMEQYPFPKFHNKCIYDD